jgi:spore coat polysaccharide biosynthesis protein SpsF
MLQYALERLKLCRRGQVVVATSDENSDRPIVDFCKSFGTPCYAGPLNNVALRFAGAVKEFGFDCFARICGDSPFIDQRIVEQAIDLFLSTPCAMVTNVRKRTFPKGQSVEVLDSKRYLSLVDDMADPEELEHVTPYCYSHFNSSEIVNFESGGDYGKVQQSVDTKEDMACFERIVAAMTRPHWEYSYSDILAMDGGGE